MSEVYQVTLWFIYLNVDIKLQMLTVSYISITHNAYISVHKNER